MAQITGGKVSYGRTIKTGDYENKRVDVELTFAVADGETYEQIFDLVSRQVVRKAHEMAGLKVPAETIEVTGKSTWTKPAETIPETVAGASVAHTAPQVPAKAPVAPEAPAPAPTSETEPVKKGRGRPKKEVAAKPKDEPELALKPTDEPEVAEEKQAKEYAALTLKAIDKAEDEITDKALLEKVKLKALVVGPDKVKVLRNTFTGSVTVQVVALDQPKRREFLNALAVLE